MIRNHLLLLAVGLAASACTDPFAAPSVRHYSDVATGGYHSCALSESGEAYCWGKGTDGQLGTGTSVDQERPTAVDTNLKFKKITAGAAHTCAIATDDRVYCWGWNVFFQIGNGATATALTPQPAMFDLKFTEVAAGDYHTCAITAESKVYCWGYNRWGQAGNGTTNVTAYPIEVTGFRAQHVTAGGQHTCAIASGGGAYCWGSNDRGQLGIGSDVHFITSPAEVSGSFRFTAVEAGESHTCGIDANGLAHCWGSNEFGQLGDAAPWREGLAGPSSPSPVVLLANVVMISAGSNHTCARDNTGRTWCWGRGTYGQLAIGSTADQRVRQPIIIQPGLQARDDLVVFEMLAAGGAQHACALAEGSIYCWGTGRFGQLGGRLLYSTVPQRVD